MAVTKKSTSKASKPTTVEVEMVFEKDTKGTRRFQNAEDGAAVTTIYVQKSAFPDGLPESIVLTIAF